MREKISQNGVHMPEKKKVRPQSPYYTGIDPRSAVTMYSSIGSNKNRPMSGKSMSKISSFPSKEKGILKRP